MTEATLIFVLTLSLLLVLAMVFRTLERFEQESTMVQAGLRSRKEAPGRHGIGLRIVDQVVEKHHGAKHLDLNRAARIFTATVVL